MAFSFGNSASFGSNAQSPFGSAGPQATFGSNPTRTSIGFTTNFGSAPSTSFGSAQPTSFGSAPSTSFGAFGSTFSASNTTPSLGFGGGFGAQPAATSTVSTFGNLFGPSGLTTSSGFGSSFGAPTSASSSFGSAFPSTATQNFFGTGTSKSNTFGTPPSNLFSTPLNVFSSPNQTTGWFGSTSTAPGGFGSTSAVLPNNPFGQMSNFTQATGTFGNNTGFGTGLFPQGQSAMYPNQSVNISNLAGLPPSAIGHIYANPSLMEPLFYSKTAVNSTKLHQVYTSVYAINIFNDERDDILKKWNMLQACWGVGKGYYNTMMPPVEYTPETPFYLFRTMGYNRLPYYENSDGIVLLLFDKPYDELKNQEEALRNGIAAILGNKPYLTVDVIDIKSFNDTQTKVKIVVYEKSITGLSRKIPALDMCAFLNQPPHKQQLNNVGTVLIVPVVTSSRIEVDEYLRKVPPGVDVQMWRTAILDNPNPNHYIPIIINGFADLHTRMLYQENQVALQQAFITKVTRDIKELHQRYMGTMSHLDKLKHAYFELQHRIVRVVVKQERIRTMGRGMTPIEELIRSRFETLHILVHSPKFYRGKIQELLSKIKLIEFKKAQRKVQKSKPLNISQEAQEQIFSFLMMQQKGLDMLIQTLNLDVQAVNLMSIHFHSHAEASLPKNQQTRNKYLLSKGAFNNQTVPNTRLFRSPTK